MADIDKEIKAYEAMREKLETEHMSKWVVVREGQLVGIFDSFESAAESAVQQFGRGPYLIRQIGAPPVTLPASVMYSRTHA
jgi:hypothetical protein